MARFAMQFCAEESCGKCTPCRIGSTRGVEVIDRLLAAPDSAERQRQRALLDDLCDTMQYGSLCALGGMTPSRAKCHASFPGRFRAGHSGASTMSCQCGAGASCNKDMGTPARAGEASITLTIDGQNISVPPGTSVMHAAALLDTAIPKLCATDSLEPFGSCRMCMVEIDGHRGYPASCTTPVSPGMVVRTQSDKLASCAAA
jgi:hypothetical protein